MRQRCDLSIDSFQSDRWVSRRSQSELTNEGDRGTVECVNVLVVVSDCKEGVLALVFFSIGCPANAEISSYCSNPISWHYRPGCVGNQPEVDHAAHPFRPVAAPLP